MEPIRKKILQMCPTHDGLRMWPQDAPFEVKVCEILEELGTTVDHSLLLTEWLICGFTGSKQVALCLH